MSSIEVDETAGIPERVKNAVKLRIILVDAINKYNDENEITRFELYGILESIKLNLATAKVIRI